MLEKADIILFPNPKLLDPPPDVQKKGTKEVRAVDIVTNVKLT